MASTEQAILVTGASGYLGSYITYQLLEEGYKVKGAARGEKVSFLRNAFEKYPEFEAVEITDITTADFGQIMKGMDSVIHCAAPMISGRADPETALKGAIDGSLNILNHAKEAGIQKVIVTGSLASFPMAGPYGPNDWNAITLEQAKTSDNPGVVYVAQKKLSEVAVVDFAEKHPEMDIILICPSYIFGPLAPVFSHLSPTVNFRSFSSAFYMYALINGPNAIFPYMGDHIDIRDLVRAYTFALRAPSGSTVGRKRFAVAHPESNSFRQAIEALATERPYLRKRLPELSSAPEWPERKEGSFDYERLENALGLKKDSFKSWKETVIDGVDSVLAVENSWKAKGLEVISPVGMPH